MQTLPIFRILGDIDIDIKPWYYPTKSQSSNRERIVTTKHPVKSPVPGIGLPSHVKSTKTQTLTEEKPSSSVSSPIIKVHEVNVVDGVPFSDRFHVVLEWKAQWYIPSAAPGQQQEKAKKGKSSVSAPRLRLTVHQHVVFTKSFWLEKVVEKNSASETQETLKIWSNLAAEKYSGAISLVEQNAIGKDGGSLTTQTEPAEAIKGLLNALRDNVQKNPKAISLLIAGICSSLLFLTSASKGTSIFSPASTRQKMN